MTHHHHGASTVIERPQETNGPVTAIAITIVGIVLVAVLVWLFAFSDVVFDGEGAPQQTDQTEIQVDPGTETDGGSTDATGDSGGTTGSGG